MNDIDRLVRAAKSVHVHALKQGWNNLLPFLIVLLNQPGRDRYRLSQVNAPPDVWLDAAPGDVIRTLQPGADMSPQVYAGLVFSAEGWVVDPRPDPEAAQKLMQERRLWTHPDRFSARYTVALSRDEMFVSIGQTEREAGMTVVDSVSDETNATRMMGAAVPKALRHVNDRILVSFEEKERP